MSFSISELGNLQHPEPVDLSELAPKGAPFPRKGRYTLRVPEVLDPDFTFGETKAGYLSATIDPTITGPSSEGYTVRYVKMSAKTYTQDERVTSQMAQFLAACGDKRNLSGDPKEAVEAVLQQSGKEFPAILDWRAYNKRTGEATEGMDSFPPDGQGGYLPWVVDEADLDEKGRPRRIRANIIVKRFLPVR
jgi:hypothetical protein